MSSIISKIANPQSKPFVIAGPCSVESEVQVMETALLLSQIEQVKVLRGGIWKPRTRPNSFEGIGEQALPWLVNAALQNNLLSATEVANAKHVEACLKAGVSLVWIGARTTVNPFSVQEIADALKGVKIPVFVKNPINPDIDLWIGAIERVANAGITQIAAIHRGFSTSEKQSYRNAPMWEIPLELKRRLSGTTILCDPSHISGKTELIAKVSQKAMDLNMDGLMIEVHPKPDYALSDKDQQLHPFELKNLIANLIIKQPEGENAKERDELLRLRSYIDDLDEKIIELLADRMNISEKIGDYKRKNKMTIFQLERWKTIFENRSMQGNSLGLSKEFLQKFLESVHKESIRRQEGK